MNGRKKIEEALLEMGIRTEAELNEAIKKIKPINISLMAGMFEERKAG